MKAICRFAASSLGGLTVCCSLLSAQIRPPAKAGPAGPSGDERVLLDAANRERAAKHLSVLRWDDKLARAAREHAQWMARMDAISHQFPGEPGLSDRVTRAGVKFTLVAENVGDAENALELHDAWMHSSGHRANLLEADSNSVGIAVVVRHRLIFAVEDFARIAPHISLDEQEHRVGALLEVRGLRIERTTGPVRQTCSLSRGVAPGLKPKYLFRYLTPDITVLPDQLVDELATRRDTYHVAAVGACAPSDSEGFDGYRLAVLLY